MKLLRFLELFLDNSVWSHVKENVSRGPMLIHGLALGDNAFSAPFFNSCPISEYYMLCNADAKIPANGIKCSGHGIPEKREELSAMPAGLKLGMACGAACLAVPSPFHLVLYSLQPWPPMTTS